MERHLAKFTIHSLSLSVMHWASTLHISFRILVFLTPARMTHQTPLKSVLRFLQNTVLFFSFLHFSGKSAPNACEPHGEIIPKGPLSGPLFCVSYVSYYCVHLSTCQGVFCLLVREGRAHHGGVGGAVEHDVTGHSMCILTKQQRCCFCSFSSLSLGFSCVG